MPKRLEVGIRIDQNAKHPFYSEKYHLKVARKTITLKEKPFSFVLKITAISHQLGYRP